MPLDPRHFKACLADGDAMQSTGNFDAALSTWSGLLDEIEKAEDPLEGPLLRLAAVVQGRIALLETRHGATSRALGAATLAVASLDRLQDPTIDDVGTSAALRHQIAILLLEMGHPLAAEKALALADSRLAALDTSVCLRLELARQRTDIAILRVDILAGLGRSVLARAILLEARARLDPLLGPEAPVGPLTCAIMLADRCMRLALQRGEEHIARVALDDSETLPEWRRNIDPTLPAPEIGTAIGRIFLGLRQEDAAMVADAVEACLGGVQLAALAGGTVDWPLCVALSRAAAEALQRIAGPGEALARVEMTLHGLRALRFVAPVDTSGESLNALVAVEMQRIALLDRIGRGAAARDARDAARRWVLGQMAQGLPVSPDALGWLGL